MSAYGIIISLSIYIAAYLTEKDAKKTGNNPNVVWDLLLVGVISGIIGARIYHVISEWSYYLQNPQNILKIWNGGLAFYGALILAIPAILFYLKRKNIAALDYLDLIAINIPLAQAIGRIGNFLNQELYGLPTNLPWKIYISPEKRLTGVENYNYFHPLFAYEMVLNLFLFYFLKNVFIKNIKAVGTGLIIYLYLAGYSLIRFFLEFLRIQSWQVYSVNVAQIISLSVFLYSIFMLTKLRSKINL